jgi:hypothetical protein
MLPTKTKTIPPPRGVGKRWELRELGLSSSLLLKMGISSKRVNQLNNADIHPVTTNGSAIINSRNQQRN